MIMSVRNEIKIGVELIHIELDAHIDNIINTILNFYIIENQFDSVNPGS